MSFLKRLSPGPALRFLRTRKRYQIGALVISSVLVVGIVYGFFRDSRFFPEYKPNITYFKSWRLDRSDAEIQAQMAIDKARHDKLRAERDKKLKARREEFQKIDNTLTGWGL
ncbi:MAG: hypothetical protein ACAH11_04625 [Sphingomonas sp.]